MTTSTSRSRRTPAEGERQRDAERTKGRLLDAALDEFAAHGFDGARVAAIAANAGVNKQLVSYYFGGKEGLYQALNDRWLAREDEFAGLDTAAEDLGPLYLHRMLADPRGTRLAIWQALNDDAPERDPQAHVDEEQDRLRERQLRGEISPDLDPAALQLALMGMTMAPILLPDQVRKLFGVGIDDPEFEQRYGDAIRQIVHRLSDRPADPPEGKTTS